MRTCVRGCGCACVRACVCVLVCGRACVRVFFLLQELDQMSAENTELTKKHYELKEEYDRQQKNLVAKEAEVLNILKNSTILVGMAGLYGRVKPSVYTIKEIRAWA